jgi:hypothetical protein
MPSPKPAELHGAFGERRTPKLARKPESDSAVAAKHPTEERLVQTTPKGYVRRSKIAEGEDSPGGGK